MRIRIGLDAGGVLKRAATKDERRRPDCFLRTVAVDDAFEAVRSLVRQYGAANVVVISKCSKTVQYITRLWFARQRFYARTGFDSSSLYFCRERSTKALIAKQLQLSHFVDDTPEVLGCMQKIVTNRLLFQPHASLPAILPSSGLVVVKNWSQARAEIDRTAVRS